MRGKRGARGICEDVYLSVHTPLRSVAFASLGRGLSKSVAEQTIPMQITVSNTREGELSCLYAGRIRPF